MDRRQFVMFGSAIAIPGFAWGATGDVWSAAEAATALENNTVILLDVRSRSEWAETGIADGAWPISMHERGFEQRLFAARDIAGVRPVALICATGGRSARLLFALKRAGYTGFIDVSEGMLGSNHGPGWIARGLPMTDIGTAMDALPQALR